MTWRGWVRTSKKSSTSVESSSSVRHRPTKSACERQRNRNERPDSWNSLEDGYGEFPHLGLPFFGVPYNKGYVYFWEDYIVVPLILGNSHVSTLQDLILMAEDRNLGA